MPISDIHEKAHRARPPLIGMLGVSRYVFFAHARYADKPVLAVGGVGRNGEKHFGYFEVEPDTAGRPRLGSWCDANEATTWLMKMFATARHRVLQ